MNENKKSLRILPRWIEYDKKVLRYNCYFKERVVDSPKECFRVRRVILSYFLEDGTIQMVEPSVENSGILQGTFLRRHKFEQPNGTLIDPENLRCGMEVTIYSRTFRIYSMDAFTREFYKSVGLDCGREEAVPDDSFTRSQSDAHHLGNVRFPEEVVRQRALIDVLFGGSVINHKTKQYLDNDGKILHFDCWWDDDSDGGFRHFFNLNWFLADDSIELIEVFPKTSSCAAAKNSFLKRTSKDLVNPRMKPSDIVIGTSFDFMTRRLFIASCDTFTRKYYKDTYSIDQPAPQLEPKSDIPHEPTAPTVERLVPRRPRPDMKKQEHTGVILRFKAKQTESDEDREFIIGFYPVDDSIAVWEIPVRNSRIIAGKFAERSVKMKEDSKPYKIDDLVVGGTLVISGVKFTLKEADEFTKKWLHETV